MTRMVLIDADITIYRVAAKNEEPTRFDNGLWVLWSDEAKTKKDFDEAIENIVETTKADDYLLCLTSKNNFRKDILPSYKGNRKDKSIAQLNEEGCQTISLETVRNIIGRVSSFFNWLVKQGYKNENPFLGVAPRRVHSARSERSSFTDHDLWLLFGTTIYTSKLYKHEWQYWLPLLGLYTGARIEELCQLKVDDFKFTDECHYIDIHGDGDAENRVKTSSSVRKIPIHNQLIRLGLLDVVARRPRGSFLFDLQRINTNLGHEPSKWFGRYKTSLGLPKGTKVFHSFRHTLRDRLTSSGAPNEHIREILGHEQVGETYGRYGSAIPVRVLANSLGKVNYGGILGD